MVVVLPFTQNTELPVEHRFQAMPKMILCSGKGGVGKTTVTAAMACARARGGKRVLVISIDPAHSLGDSLGLDLSDNEIHPVESVKNLSALELKIKLGKHGTINGSDDSDRIDAGRLLGDIFFPVMSEEMSMLESLLRMSQVLYWKDLKFDEMYIDGAPAGHMLRALSFPFRMNEYLGKIAGIFEKFKRLLSFDPRKRDFLKRKEALVDALKVIMNVLSNEELSTMVLVTIPETMALMETERTFRELQTLGINVKNIIINKIHETDITNDVHCPFCAERIRHEAEMVTQIVNQFNDVSITKVPLLNREIEGTSQLCDLEPFLFTEYGEPSMDDDLKTPGF
ncbi:MAG TPA: ArsA family ATPase [Candidatus Lokiarchaeia archaeon]|nr:ArsA family ATPase [Candidatus Lokiarchaeia archaeon]